MSTLFPVFNSPKLSKAECIAVKLIDIIMRGKNDVLSAKKLYKQIAYRSFASIQLPSSVQSENSWKNAFIYSFSADSTEGEGAKG